ncbi:MAG: hypothetical protein M0008_12495 [Actinomycetota bacterium]|nr:hypothetical protein [Actinomycetota bacterium]
MTSTRFNMIQRWLPEGYEIARMKLIVPTNATVMTNNADARAHQRVVNPAVAPRVVTGPPRKRIIPIPPIDKTAVRHTNGIVNARKNGTEK